MPSKYFQLRHYSFPLFKPSCSRQLLLHCTTSCIHAVVRAFVVNIYNLTGKYPLPHRFIQQHAGRNRQIKAFYLTQHRQLDQYIALLLGQPS